MLFRSSFVVLAALFSAVLAGAEPAAKELSADQFLSIVRNPPQEIYREVRANADQFQDFTVSAAGCVVECQVEETGYSWAEDGEVRTPVYGEASSYWLEFSVRKL